MTNLSFPHESTLEGLIKSLSRLEPISIARRNATGLSLMDQIREKYDSRPLDSIPVAVIRKDIDRLEKERIERDVFDVECPQAITTLYHLVMNRTRKGKGRP